MVKDVQSHDLPLHEGAHRPKGAELSSAEQPVADATGLEDEGNVAPGQHPVLDEVGVPRATHRAARSTPSSRSAMEGRRYTAVVSKETCPSSPASSTRPPGLALR